MDADDNQYAIRRDVLEDLRSLPLPEAEIALTQARQLLFARYFEGAAIPPTVDAAATVARTVGGMNLWLAAMLLESVRIELWTFSVPGAADRVLAELDITFDEGIRSCRTIH